MKYDHKCTTNGKVHDMAPFDINMYFPFERDKFFNIISTANRPVLILSGDRHLGGMYKHESLNIYEVTSSSFNKEVPLG